MHKLLANKMLQKL